jgi:hypothetical protein
MYTHKKFYGASDHAMCNTQNRPNTPVALPIPYHIVHYKPERHWCAQKLTVMPTPSEKVDGPKKWGGDHIKEQREECKHSYDTGNATESDKE